jgi:hypothetical protein
MGAAAIGAAPASGHSFYVDAAAPPGDLLGVAALAAALERALRFKTNRWLG